MTHLHVKNSGLSLLAIALAAGIVRFLFLGRTELWGDEILFVNIMANIEVSPWQVFLSYWDICVSMAQLPLPGVVQNAYMHLASLFVPQIQYQVFALRLPGALAGVASVLGIHALGRRWVRSEIQWAATAFATFLFFPVYYSREVYCYPYVMCFATFSFLYFHKALFDRHSTALTTRLLFLGSASLGLCHFGCSVALAAMTLISAIRWRWMIQTRRPIASQKALRALLACSLAALIVTPYWIRILLANNVHVASEAPFSIFQILNDMVSKFFLGDHLFPSIAAWALLLTGLVCLWNRRRSTRIPVLLLLLISIVLAILCKYSQYASSRYFALLVPIVYITLAAGLWILSTSLAQSLRHPSASRWIYILLTTTVIGIHIFLFLPPLFRATEKGYPHASSARWLNENGIPGAPYFYDSGGFDMRYIPGYYSVPHLIPTIPIAWNGLNFEQTVRQTQRELIRQFPVSYYLRNPAYCWEEADSLFQRRVEFRNLPIQTLRRRGIFPDAHTDNLHAEARDILFNTPEDAISIARDAGASVFVEIQGFQCIEINPTEYARQLVEPVGTFRIHNFRESPISGVLQFSGTVWTSNETAALHLTLPPDIQMDAAIPPNQPTHLSTPFLVLPLGVSSLRIETDSPNQTDLILFNVEFSEQP